MWVQVPLCPPKIKHKVDDLITNIYCIKNDINNKCYIGKTIYTINKRFSEHIKDARNYKYVSKLHRAILKYGVEHFYIILLEQCEDNDSGDREKYYIQLYNSVKNGYNISYGGEGESQVDISQLKDLWEQKYSFKDIAKITGHTTKTVATRLRAIGCESWYRNQPNNKDKGKKVEFNNIQFNSLTLLARYLKENFDIFSNKKETTIIKGICKSLVHNTKYCGYKFNYI